MTFRLNLLNDREHFGPWTALDMLEDLFGPWNKPVRYLMCGDMQKRLAPSWLRVKEGHNGVKCDSAGVVDWYIQAEYPNGVRIGLIVKSP